MVSEAGVTMRAPTDNPQQLGEHIHVAATEDKDLEL